MTEGISQDSVVVRLSGLCCITRHILEQIRHTMTNTHGVRKGIRRLYPEADS
jgi:hypothetical protein